MTRLGATAWVSEQRPPSKTLSELQTRSRVIYTSTCDTSLDRRRRSGLNCRWGRLRPGSRYGISQWAEPSVRATIRLPCLLSGRFSRRRQRSSSLTSVFTSKRSVLSSSMALARTSRFSQMRPGNFVKLAAHFDIDLADYGVKRGGDVLPLQVGERAAVTVFVLGSDAGAEEADSYRQKARAVAEHESSH